MMIAVKASRYRNMLHREINQACVKVAKNKNKVEERGLLGLLWPSTQKLLGEIKILVAKVDSAQSSLENIRSIEGDTIVYVDAQDYARIVGAEKVRINGINIQSSAITADKITFGTIKGIQANHINWNGWVNVEPSVSYGPGK